MSERAKWRRSAPEELSLRLKKLDNLTVTIHDAQDGDFGLKNLIKLLMILSPR